MSDDSFMREVEDELRSDKVSDFWKKYKLLVIGGAIAIVLGTAGSGFYTSYSQNVAGESGDQFLSAIELSNDGKHDEAIAQLETLGKEGVGQYPALAQIRLASEFSKKGEPDKAVEAFDAIANDTNFDDTLRNVARLRAGLLLVDSGTYDQVSDRLQSMSETGKSFRHSARDGLGLSAWKHEQYKNALVWFQAISEDQGSPNGIRQRAGLMLQLLAGKGFVPDEPKEEPEPAAAIEAN